MNEENKNKQIKLGIIFSYLAIFINIVAAILYTPWMISKIGQGNYGLYVLATSLITLLSVDFGLSSATTRFITKHLANGDQDSINKIVSLIYKLYFIISIIIFLILFIVYFFIEDIYVGLNPQEINTFKVIFIILSLYTVISFPFITLDGILSAYEEFIKLKCCDIFNKLLTILLIVISLFLNKGVIELVLINSIVGVITIFIKMLIIRKCIPLELNFQYRNYSLLKTIFTYSFWVTISQLFQRLIFNITPSILAIVSNSVSMSVFGAAMSLEGYSYTISNALGNVFLPKVSRLSYQKSNDEIHQLSIKVGKTQLYVISLIFVGFLLVGKDFIYLWLGESFSQVYVCALLLIFPCIFHTPQKIQQMLILANNQVKYESFAYLIMGITNIILSFILSSKFGAIGACLSIFIAYLIRTIILNFIYIKKLHLNIKDFYIEVYIKNLVLIFLVILVGIILNVIFNQLSWKIFIIKVIIIILSFIVFYILLLNKEKRILLIKKIRNFRKNEKK